MAQRAPTGRIDANVCRRNAEAVKAAAKLDHLRSGAAIRE
jgi:hypothetical protein